VRLTLGGQLVKSVGFAGEQTFVSQPLKWLLVFVEGNCILILVNALKEYVGNTNRI
jgi:hypothetical protein